MSEEELRKEIASLREEVKGLKEFVNALYNMIVEDDEPEYMNPHPTSSPE